MSRELEHLTSAVEEMARETERLASMLGVEILIYSTWRSCEEQAILYRSGRSFKRILAKAQELRHDYKRPDLAELLLSVGPNHNRSVVTYAGPGQSAHNYGLAFDAVPMIGGKPVWGDIDPEELALWSAYGKAAETAGLVWAGHWRKKKRERPHAQAPGFNWRKMITRHQFGIVNVSRT